MKNLTITPDTRDYHLEEFCGENIKQFTALTYVVTPLGDEKVGMGDVIHKNDYGEFRVLRPDNYIHLYPGHLDHTYNCLRLSPLSAIKDKEMKGIFDSRENLEGCIKMYGLAYRMPFNSAQINKLRRLGYDVDGLIDAGIAIDKTTLNQ